MKIIFIVLTFATVTYGCPWISSGKSEKNVRKTEVDDGREFECQVGEAGSIFTKVTVTEGSSLLCTLKACTQMGGNLKEVSGDDCKLMANFICPGCRKGSPLSYMTRSYTLSCVYEDEITTQATRIASTTAALTTGNKNTSAVVHDWILQGVHNGKDSDSMTAPYTKGPISINFVIGGIAGGGICLMSIIVIILVCRYKRSKKHSKTSASFISSNTVKSPEAHRTRHLPTVNPPFGMNSSTALRNDGYKVMPEISSGPRPANLFNHDHEDIPEIYSGPRPANLVNTHAQNGYGGRMAEPAYLTPLPRPKPAYLDLQDNRGRMPEPAYLKPLRVPHPRYVNLHGDRPRMPETNLSDTTTCLQTKPHGPCQRV